MDTIVSSEDSSVIETNSAEKNEIIEETSAKENKETSSNSQVPNETDVSDDTVVASIVASIDDAMKEDSPIINPSDDAIKSQQAEIVVQEVVEVDVELGEVRAGSDETVEEPGRLRTEVILQSVLRSHHSASAGENQESLGW